MNILSKIPTTKYLFVQNSTIYDQKSSQDEDKCGYVLVATEPSLYATGATLPSNTVYRTDELIFKTSAEINEADNTSFDAIKNKVTILTNDKNHYIVEPTLRVTIKKEEVEEAITEYYYGGKFIHDGDKVNGKTVTPDYYISHGYPKGTTLLGVHRIDVENYVAEQMIKGVSLKAIASAIPSYFVLNKQKGEQSKLLKEGNSTTNSSTIITIASDGKASLTTSSKDSVMAALKTLIAKKLIEQGDKMLTSYNDTVTSDLSISSIKYSDNEEYNKNGKVSNPSGDEIGTV